jgi:hypothetical protein
MYIVQLPPGGNPIAVNKYVKQIVSILPKPQPGGPPLVAVHPE